MAKEPEAWAAAPGTQTASSPSASLPSSSSCPFPSPGRSSSRNMPGLKPHPSLCWTAVLVTGSQRPAGSRGTLSSTPLCLQGQKEGDAGRGRPGLAEVLAEDLPFALSLCQQLGDSGSLHQWEHRVPNVLVQEGTDSNPECEGLSWPGPLSFSQSMGFFDHLGLLATAFSMQLSVKGRY